MLRLRLRLSGGSTHFLFWFSNFLVQFHKDNFLLNPYFKAGADRGKAVSPHCPAVARNTELVANGSHEKRHFMSSLCMRGSK